MRIEELVNLLVPFLVLLFLIASPAIEGYRRRKRKEGNREDSEFDQDEQAKTLRNFLKSLQTDMKEGIDEEEQPQLSLRRPRAATAQPFTRQQEQRSVGDEFRYRAPLDSFQQKTKVEARHLPISIEERYRDHPIAGEVVSADLRSDKNQLVARPSRAKAMIDRLPSRQQLFLFHEIFGKPKGM